MAVNLRGSLNFNTTEQTTDAEGDAELPLSGLTIADGDTLVIVYNNSATSDQILSASGDNSGPCQKEVDAYISDSRDVNLGVFIAQQGSTPDTTITVSGGSSSVAWCGRILHYRGAVGVVDVATPEPVTGTDGDDANPPAITPTTVGAKIVAIYGAVRAGGTVAWTPPANVSNFVEVFTNAASGSEPVIGTGDHDWTGGAFDPDAATGGGSSTGNSWIGATIALRPSRTFLRNRRRRRKRVDYGHPIFKNVRS